MSCSLVISCIEQLITNEIIIKNSVNSEGSHVTFSNEKGSEIISFSTSGDWTANVEDNASSWCHINKTSGQSGNNTIEINVDENNTYDERNASLTIVCGRVKGIITITQKQKDALLLESNKVEIKEEGGSVILTVKSNLSYSCEIDESCQSWIHNTNTKTRGLSTSQINLQIDANQEVSNREGKIYVTAGDLFEEVTIYQEGTTPKVIISNKDITVSSSGDTIKIEVASNTEYEYILPNVDWISEQKTRAISTFTHYFTIAENCTYDHRIAEIQFINKATDEVEIVKVTQMQRDALVLESNKIEIKEEGGSVILTVKSNLSYSCEIDESCQSWIHNTNTKTRGLSTSQINLQIDANQEVSNREGKIYVTAGDLFEEVTIYQEGTTPKVIISNKDITVSSSGDTIKIEVASNTEYEYILPNVDWISEQKTRAISTFTHYFTIAENSTYDHRIAEIQFINKATNETEIVKVSQMQKDAIIVAKNMYNLNGEETILDFVINTNVNFETRISDDWIQTYEHMTTRALTQKALSFRVEKNPQTIERLATISFVYGDIKQTVTIIQDGRTDNMRISITHSETEFSSLELEGNNISGTVNWGDGATQSDITKGHSYKDSNTKTTIFETIGVNKFRIKNINSISSITIYCNEGKNGSAEDFKIENKEWD